MNVDLSILFTRPYWLDEWHTVLPASRPTPAAVLSDLRHGADFAPPLLHLSLWILRAVGGGELPPAVARSFMLACTIGAALFTFLLLRRRFDRAPSLAGALAILTHGLVVAYAFEVRFYAPWLLCAAAVAWTFSLDASEPRSRRRDAAIAITAAMLCVTHWFGVVTLGLMCLGAVLAFGRDRRTGIRRVAPAAMGLLALGATLPLLVGQRGSIREKSWIAELSWPQFRDLALSYWGAVPVLLALAAIAIAMLLPRFKEPLRRSAMAAVRDPSIAALLGLAAMPVALTVISLGQQAMLPRYGLATALAWAPLIALVVQLLARSARVAAVAVLCFAVLLQIGGQLSVQRQVQRMVRLDGLLLREACRSAEGVAFVTRLQMYYHTDEIRASCPRAAYLVVPPATLARLFVGPNAPVQAQHRLEGEFAQLHGRLYGFPNTVTPAHLDSLAHFVVMAEPWSLPRDTSGREFFSRIVFPNHRATPLNGYGTLYVRATTGTP